MNGHGAGGVDGDRTVARANAYATLAQALASPADWPSDFADRVRERLLPLEGPARDKHDALVEATGPALAARESTLLAHTKLFLGPYEIAVAPWASLYLDPSRQLMGDVSRFVAQAYAEAGVGPGAGPTDAPDHITHELEFMYFLTFQEASTGKEVWLQRQRDFWNEHLALWLRDFAQALQRVDANPFYTALGTYLKEFAGEESSLLGASAASNDNGSHE